MNFETASWLLIRLSLGVLDLLSRTHLRFSSGSLKPTSFPFPSSIIFTIDTELDWTSLQNQHKVFVIAYLNHDLANVKKMLKKELFILRIECSYCYTDYGGTDMCCMSCSGSLINLVKTAGPKEYITS